MRVSLSMQNVCAFIYHRTVHSNTAVQSCLETMNCTVSEVSAMIKEIYQLPHNRWAALFSRLCRSRDAEAEVCYCIRLNDTRQQLAHLLKHLLIREGDGGHACVYLPVIAFTLGLAASETDASAYKSFLDLLNGAGEIDVPRR